MITTYGKAEYSNCIPERTKAGERLGWKVNAFGAHLRHAQRPWRIR